MKDMPPSAIKWYQMWIESVPESLHPTTLDLFYIFVGVLLAHSKKERLRYWLEENLTEDCPNLSKEDIKWYGEIYEHIKNFKTVSKRITAKLIAEDEFEKKMKEVRKKGET